MKFEEYLTSFKFLVITRDKIREFDLDLSASEPRLVNERPYVICDEDASKHVMYIYDGSSNTAKAILTEMYRRFSRPDLNNAYDPDKPPTPEDYSDQAAWTIAMKALKRPASAMVSDPSQPSPLRLNYYPRKDLMPSQDQSLITGLMKEESQLATRLMRLARFLNSSRVKEIDLDMFNLMREQELAMTAYHNALATRIDRLTAKI